MKTAKIILALCLPLFLFSCVSSKKFKKLSADYAKELENEKSCQDKLKEAQATIADLQKQIADLKAKQSEQKETHDRVLDALQSSLVLSTKQAESVKQSLENLTGKEQYIQNLQAALARKDSMNMNLVMNLKSSLGDVNDKDINIKVEKGVVYVDLSDRLLFNSGKYVVTGDAKKVLAKVAKVLNANPDFDFLVEGHTDTVAIHNDIIEDNWDLSVKRATAVVRILEKDYGINPSRITAGGRSKFLPVADNSTDAGRAQNRRTRIIILPQLDQFFKLLEKK